MQIVDFELEKLKPYENNPRINAKAVDAVAESIKAFGWRVPIVVDRDNVIVAGHTRYMAAQKLGLSKVPCVVADDLTPEQIRAYRLADNQTSSLSEWDLDSLALELQAIEMSDLDIDMEAFGFEARAEFDDFEESQEVKKPEVLVFDKMKIPITEEEKEALHQRIDEYVDKNGVLNGFIWHLVTNDTGNDTDTGTGDNDTGNAGEPQDR